MAAMRWRVVVADESHMMRTHNKAPDAAFTEAAAAIGRAADRLLLLSGTPSLNRPFDLFRQVGVETLLDLTPLSSMLASSNNKLETWSWKTFCWLGNFSVMSAQNFRSCALLSRYRFVHNFSTSQHEQATGHGANVQHSLDLSC